MEVGLSVGDDHGHNHAHCGTANMVSDHRVYYLEQLGSVHGMKQAGV